MSGPAGADGTRRWVAAAMVVAGVIGGALLFWHGITVQESRPATRTWAVPEPGDCFDAPAASLRADPSAPTVGSRRHWMPWASGRVACTEPHTLEVAYVGTAPSELLLAAREADGAAGISAREMLISFARSTCGAKATRYLGYLWHLTQVAVLADWVSPNHSGDFVCALAQVPGPGSQWWLSRRSSLAGALEDPASPLLISCVQRDRAELSFASCDGWHDGELVGLYWHKPMGAAFDELAIRRAATAGCRMAMADYLGLPYGPRRGDLYVGYTGPTRQDSWWGSDQVFACFAMTNVGAAQLRGSVREIGTRPLPV